MRARFGRRAIGVDTNSKSTLPLCLVRHHADELAPSRISNRAGKMMVFGMFLIFKVSKTSAWLSFASFRDALCRKSARSRATRRCCLARRRRAFSRFALPFCLRDSARCDLTSHLCVRRYGFGAPIFVPVRNRHEGFEPEIEASHKCRRVPFCR